MPAQRKSIGRSRNPASHTAILQAAAALLLEVGPAGASIEAIAKRAASGKPTIYRWWPKRAWLMLEVYRAGAGQGPDAAPPPPPADGQAAFQAFIDHLVSLWQGTVCGPALRAMVADSQLDEEARTLLREEIIAPMRAELWSIIEQAGDQGELRTDAEYDLIIDLIIDGLLFRVLMQRLSSSGQPIARRYAQTCWTMMAKPQQA